MRFQVLLAILATVLAIPIVLATIAVQATTVTSTVARPATTAQQTPNGTALVKYGETSLRLPVPNATCTLRVETNAYIYTCKPPTPDPATSLREKYRHEEEYAYIITTTCRHGCIYLVGPNGPILVPTYYATYTARNMPIHIRHGQP